MSTAKLVWIAASSAVIAACHQAPAPTPDVERPTLERRVVNIDSPKSGRLLSAPSEALLTRAGVPGVFVYRQGRARFQMVKTGRTAAGRVEILSGLGGGETLVVGDLKAVRDGSPLTPIE